MPLFRTASLFLLFAISHELLGQDRCGIVQYEKNRHLANPKLETEGQFEEWLKARLAEPKLKTFGAKKTGSPTYTIPVVVHIIHNGEPVGTGANISDAQVNSQITVLNNDYQRLNADASQTPAEFVPAAGGFDVQFVLAKQDPEGLPTSGITRTLGTKTSWALADDAAMKALSYWPAENYLNLWVVNLNDGGYIGYAHLPVSTLPGLENSPNDRLTDGVVIHYRAFGSVDGPGGPFDLEASFNKGRTATHEIGHFFGLRHIWGDGSCSTDYVDDTPPQSTSTSGCPAHPQSSCANAPFNPAYMAHKMFQDFMDYSNDACMNLFTVGQIGRMTTVLQNSPRRASLLISPGATDPFVASTDLGVKEIVSPGVTVCPGPVTPSVAVRNYGTNVITAARVQLKLGGAVLETKDFTLNLVSLGETTLAFSPLTLTIGSTGTVEFEVLQVNGVPDDKSTNDKATSSFVVPQTAPLPIVESFTTLPPSWSIQNPDGLKTWSAVDVSSGGISNKAVFMNFYDYDTEGTLDRYLSPVLDLTLATTATLKFDKAYARFPGSNADRLRILVSTDCGADLSQAVEVLNQTGTSLATTADTGSSFKPTSSSQWKNEIINLNQFAGSPHVQIVFEATNGYGNNLYLDNVVVLSDDVIDIALTAVSKPGPVICENDPAPVVTVKNLSSFTVNSFNIDVTTNGSTKTQFFTNQPLATGEEKDFTLNNLSLVNGSNTIQFEVKDPNGLTDQKPGNNTLEVKRVVNSIQERIPIRQNFNGSFQTEWTTLSQGDEQPWEVAGTNKNVSMLYPGFSNTNKGQEAWLVSPVLDFSQAWKASVQFEASYGKNTTGIERLKVYASQDCGVTYSQTIFDLPADQFSSANSTSAWAPVNDADWKRQYINLDGLTGQASARLAFVVTNDNGNNLYLDNIEFYLDDDPYPVAINSSFVVYPSGESASVYKITFNLPEKVPAYIQVYSLTGQMMMSYTVEETLNQTFTLDMSAETSGLYIVRLRAGTEVSSTKIFVAR